MIGHLVTLLALEIHFVGVCWIDCHMPVVCCVGCIPMGQRKVAPLIGISTTSLGMALEAVCPNWLVDRLDGLIYGHWGHGDIIWHKQAVYLFSFVSNLMA